MPVQLSQIWSNFGFLPRDASAERGNAIVSGPSVCDI